MLNHQRKPYSSTRRVTTAEHQKDLHQSLPLQHQLLSQYQFLIQHQSLPFYHQFLIQHQFLTQYLEYFDMESGGVKKMKQVEIAIVTLDYAGRRFLQTRITLPLTTLKYCEKFMPVYQLLNLKSLRSVEDLIDTILHRQEQSGGRSSPSKRYSIR